MTFLLPVRNTEQPAIEAPTSELEPGDDGSTRHAQRTTLVERAKAPVESIVSLHSNIACNLM